MYSTVARFISALLPTVCLYLSLCWPYLSRQHQYNRAFGGKNYYLDMRFSTNPLGVLRSVEDRTLGFRGVFIGHLGLEEVTGTWRKSGELQEVQFQTRRGFFEGRIRKVRGRCEPRLDFILHSTNPIRGSLRGGFCHS